MYPYQNYNQNFNQALYQNYNQPQTSFVTVRNEKEARDYPIAPGNSVLFRDETSPHIYCKTMGYSQLDTPTFDKYRLEKEDVSEVKETVFATREELAAVITELKAEIDGLKPKKGKKDE